ncbi:MAG: hypothetical protein ACLKAO_03920 [Alkaliphilus sp.]
MNIKRWSGTAWVSVSEIKRWNGSAWVNINSLKRWSGSAWLDISMSSNPQLLPVPGASLSLPFPGVTPVVINITPNPTNDYPVGAITYGWTWTNKTPETLSYTASTNITTGLVHCYSGFTCSPFDILVYARAMGGDGNWVYSNAVTLIGYKFEDNVGGGGF